MAMSRGLIYQDADIEQNCKKQYYFKKLKIYIKPNCLYFNTTIM